MGLKNKRSKSKLYVPSRDKMLSQIEFPMEDQSKIFSLLQAVLMNNLTAFQMVCFKRLLFLIFQILLDTTIRRYDECEFVQFFVADLTPERGVTPDWSHSRSSINYILGRTGSYWSGCRRTVSRTNVSYETKNIIH